MTSKSMNRENSRNAVNMDTHEVEDSISSNSHTFPFYVYFEN